MDNTLNLGCLEVCKEVDDLGNTLAPGASFTICVGDDCRVFTDGDCEDFTGLVPGNYLISENDPVSSGLLVERMGPLPPLLAVMSVKTTSIRSQTPSTANRGADSPKDSGKRTSTSI